MLRIWFTMLITLWFTAPLSAQITLDPSSWVPNRPPGRCAWCALETLARHHNIPALHNLTRDKDSVSSIRDIEELLQAKKVSYQIQYCGSYTMDLLKTAIQKKRGAVVGFRPLITQTTGHIVLVTNLEEHSVTVLDPNDTMVTPRRMDRVRFTAWWDGFTLVLDKK